MAYNPYAIGAQQPVWTPLNLADTYAQLARLRAADQATAANELTLSERQRTLGRTEQARALLAEAVQPIQGPAPGMGPRPQGLTAAPGVGSPPMGSPSLAPRPMADSVPFASPEQGMYGLTAPPLAPGMPPSFQQAPASMQAPAMIPGAPGSAPPPPAAPQGLTAPPMGAPPPPPQGLTVPPQAPPTATERLAQSIPQLMPLPNMQKVQQALLVDPETTSQWYNAYITQRGTQLADIDRNNKLVHKVTTQILAEPGSYQRGLDYLREQGVPVPKDMPPVYDAALVTWHNKMSAERMGLLEQAKVEHELASAFKDRMAGAKDAREAGRPPKVDYGYGPEMDAALDARYGEEIRRSGQPPTPAMVGQATRDVDARQVGRSVEAFRQTAPERATIARQTGAAAQGERPLEGPERIRMNAFTQAEDIATHLAREFTPEERARYVGLGGLRKTAAQVAQLTADAGYGKADPKFARFAALNALAQAEAFGEAGKALTATEKEVVFGYIPTGGEISSTMYEQKLALAQQRLPALLDRELKLATSPRRELPGMRARGELSGQDRLNTPVASGRPVTEMSPEEIRAEIAALRGTR